MKERTLKDLTPANPHRMIDSDEKRKGALMIANFINGLGLTNNGYAAGDCALFKFCLITKRQVRKGKKVNG